MAVAGIMEWMKTEQAYIELHAKQIKLARMSEISLQYVWWHSTFGHASDREPQQSPDDEEEDIMSLNI